MIHPLASYTRAGAVVECVLLYHTRCRKARQEALQMHLFLDGRVLEVIANDRSPSEAQVWLVPESMAVGAFGPLGVSSAVAWRLGSTHR